MSDIRVNKIHGILIEDVRFNELNSRVSQLEQSGGGGSSTVEIAQETGSSKSKVMSQDATTKELTKKVDKVTSTSANPRIYGVDEGGNQTTYFATQTPNPNTIPMRDASGRFQVADGVAPKQAVNKSQLDAIANNLILDLNIENGSGENSLKQIPDGDTFKGQKKGNVTTDVLEDYNADASGQNSTILGGKNRAEGKRATAIGGYNVAAGASSLATGEQTITEGRCSFTSGQKTRAAGWSSIAVGESTVATGIDSFASGVKTQANGYASFTTGQNNTTDSAYTFISGSNNQILKKYPTSGSTPPTPSDPSQDPSFNVLDHLGDNAHVEGGANLCYGYAGHAEGLNNIVYSMAGHAQGTNNIVGRSDDAGWRCTAATACGDSCVAEGANSFVVGRKSKATGTASIALGVENTAQGVGSVTIGVDNTTTHIGAIAIGRGLTSTRENGVVLGICNNPAETSEKAILSVGNGNVGSGEKSTAFQVLSDGRVKVKAVPKDNDDVVRKFEINSCIKADGQNIFTDLNTFREAVQLDKGATSDTDISITNGVMKVMNNTDNGDGTNKDYVAQYDADKIVLEENGTKNTLKYPRKDGTFATLDDIKSAITLKNSKFESTDDITGKEDAWVITNEDATVSIQYNDDTSATAINISKNHVGMQAAETSDNGTNSAVIAFDTGSISIGVNNEAEAKSSVLIIDKNGVLLNSKKVAAEDDLAGKVNKLAQSTVAEVYVRDENGDDKGAAYSYTAEGGTFAKRSASGTLAVETPTQPKDAANKEFVEAKCANIPVGVVISDIAGSTSGVLADPDFQALQSNPNNYILKDGKKYDRSSERSQEDSLTYVYNGYLSNRDLQESIEITVSAKSWVLNSSKLITDKTIANGKLGAVSIKNDFADGLEVSQTDGNLSIYGALDADIASRASKRPITPTNLNKAVIAALTDDNRTIPTEDQQATFKAAWGFTASQYEAGLKVLDLVDISVNATKEATSGTINDASWEDIIADEVICLKFNNEYYITSDDEHTPGVKSFTHVGWNGNANQTKSINITLSSKAWVLKIGYSKYYQHYIKLNLKDEKIVYYNFPSTQSTEYTLNTLPVQPDDSHSQFTLLINGNYSSVNGQLYRDGVGTLKIILNGIYTTDGVNISYLSLTGQEVATVKDEVKD